MSQNLTNSSGNQIDSPEEEFNEQDSLSHVRYSINA
jgi:hypothetical protein